MCGGGGGGGGVRVAECLRQVVPNRWGRVRKRSFTYCFCIYTRSDKGSGVGRVSLLSCWTIGLKEIEQVMRGCSRDGINESDS